MTTQSPPFRVLVVDDEPLISWSVAEILGECGDVVTAAGTGAEAVRALSEAREPVDVVLLDYHLPDVRNLSLLSAVRRLSPTSRVILVSAYLTLEVAEEALALGASQVITKPVDIHNIFTLVHSAPRPAADASSRA